MARLPDDETLMAYVDGALPEAQMRAVEALLQTNPELSARLVPFTVTRDRLPGLISAALDGPLPDRLVQTVLNTAIGGGTAPRASLGSKAPLLHRLAQAFCRAGR